jgi:GNAT superfamily N-acetyltransferase
MISSLLNAMEYNYNEYAQYVARLPYMHLQHTPEMTILMSEKIPSWNVVLRTQLSSQNIATSIEATLSQFRALNVPLVWHILPSTQPSDLERHLVEHGFGFFDEEPHMLIELATVAFLPSNPQDFTIERVTNVDSFTRWYEVLLAGFFSNMPELGQVCYDVYTMLGFDSLSPFRHYIGYMKGEPVAVSTLLRAGGIAGIYDVSTLPAARGKGYGTAITLAALQEAQQLDCRYVCLQASQMGYPIYKHIGFEEQFRERKYQWSPDTR